MRIGSLFSGAGGLDMAVEHVFGAATAWHCEIDPAASKVLAHRWPGVPNLRDITTTDWANVESVDIICGGWPCQPFSLAGKRKGAADERALWPYVAHTVRMVRPRIVVLENVSAVLGPEFSRVANDLAALGYEFTWTCLRASDVGAPHRRERLFIVAYAACAGCERGSRADTEPQRRSQRESGQDAYRCPALATDAAFTERGGTQRQHLGAGRIGAAEPRECLSASAIGGGDASDTESDTRRIINRDSAAASDSACDGRQQGRPESARLERGSDAALSGHGHVELLPTPNAQDGNGGGRYNSDGHQTTLPGEVRLPPTPRSSDCFGAGQHGDGGMDLRTTIAQLSEDNNAASEIRPGKALRDMREATTTQAVQRQAGRSDTVSEPENMRSVLREQSCDSPGGFAPLAGAATDASGPLRGLRDEREVARSSQRPQPGEQRSGELAGALWQLPSQAALARGPQETDRSYAQWGRYAAAIKRWEAVLGRPAPNPTEPNRNGKPRLNPEFSSWMMGWPAGWVDVGISRNDQLRIIGNGVVPQQATAALKWLLNVSEAAA